MSRLTALRSRLGTVPSMVRASALVAPGREQRIRGRAGVEQRDEVLKAGQYVCVRCKTNGLYRTATQVDHRIPLHLGGSNDPSNLDPLCKDCHDSKTAQETADRARGGM